MEREIENICYGLRRSWEAEDGYLDWCLIENALNDAFIKGKLKGQARCLN